MEIIVTTKEQLSEVVADAVNAALANRPTIKSEEQVRTITSIKELAEFLHCSCPKAQSVKNSGSIRVYQTGRKFLIRTDELLQDLATIKQSK